MLREDDREEPQRPPGQELKGAIALEPQPSLRVHLQRERAHREPRALRHQEEAAVPPVDVTKPRMLLVEGRTSRR